MMTNRQTDELANKLIEIGMLVAPEAEGLDLSDHDFDMEALAQLRSRLSSMRVAIDLVNKALAVYWNETYPGERLTLENVEWKVGRSKTKELVDADMFMAFLASKDVDGLKRLFTPSRLTSVVKVSGMTPAERETFISEGYTNAGLSINHKEIIA
ncbi:MAG: hypothetical protein DRH08_00645 [Deltaproteobacteria bacterium]|nr:MAG: hypothetical protein DRH08_00645 [Deltaproteobacteria bacterium]